MMEFNLSPPLLSMKERIHRIESLLSTLQVENPDLAPVRVVHKRKLSGSFWGQAWNHNLTTYPDCDFRLEQGRSHLRAGGIVNLRVEHTVVHATVWDLRLYEVRAQFAPLPTETWEQFLAVEGHSLPSLVPLLQGKVSDQMLARIVDPNEGLFPSRGDLRYTCTCTDDASLCGHIAAVLYGIGVRFDEEPQLFFQLRGIPLEAWLQNAGDALQQEAGPADQEDLESLFDIELL